MLRAEVPAVLAVGVHQFALVLLLIGKVLQASCAPGPHPRLIITTSTENRPKQVNNIYISCNYCKILRTAVCNGSCRGSKHSLLQQHHEAEHKANRSVVGV